MMFRTILLASLLSAVDATKSIRRLMEDNTDVLTELGDVDMSCTISMAMDGESCRSTVDAKNANCAWCPMGPDFGLCISQDMAMMVNFAEIPHLHCSAVAVEESDEDAAFFTDLEECMVGGVSGDDCMSAGDSCQYCVTEEPAFGVCFSEAFVEEAKSFDDPDDPDESFEAVFKCASSDDEEDILDVGALADSSCFIDGNPQDFFGDVKQQCGNTRDARDEPCVVASVMGMMDFCMTDTQKDLMDYVMDELSDMGIDDPMAAWSAIGQGSSEMGMMNSNGSSSQMGMTKMMEDSPMMMNMNDHVYDSEPVASIAVVEAVEVEDEDDMDYDDEDFDVEYDDEDYDEDYDEEEDDEEYDEDEEDEEYSESDEEDSGEEYSEEEEDNQDDYDSDEEEALDAEGVAAEEELAEDEVVTVHGNEQFQKVLAQIVNEEEEEEIDEEDEGI